MVALVPMTGRGEDFVLWELPYARGLCYLHAGAAQNGTVMELVEGRGDDEERGGMLAEFERMKARANG